MKPATPFAFRGSKVPKQVDECYAADGLSPEEVNDIRYSGIRLDMSTTAEFRVGESTDSKTLSNSHFHLANDAAATALSTYKILLAHEIRDKLLCLEGKFDDVGLEVFALMHMMRAFLGKRPDHAPVELTVVRLRLGTGVEISPDKEVCHIFPSPKPMPFAKGGDFRAAQKEWHEIDEDEFQYFDEDFIHIFYKILLSLEPRSVKKSISNFMPKLPLVICRSHNVQNVVMMFEYLHQRALLSQKAGLSTKAPADFLVSEKINLVFCELRAFDTAIRGVLRELQLTVEPVIEPLNIKMVNLCEYHKTTNKVECTTYCVSEMVEQLLIFSRYWGLEAPSRFVEAFNFQDFVEPIGRLQLAAYFQENSAEAKSVGGGAWWNDQIQTSNVFKAPIGATDDTTSDRGSDAEAEADIFRIPKLPKRATKSPDVLGRGTLLTDSNSAGPSSSALRTLSSEARRVPAGVGRGTVLKRRAPFVAATEATGISSLAHFRESLSSNKTGPTPSPTPMGISRQKEYRF